MPFALILIATVFIVTGFRGTVGAFLSQILTDAEGFVVWIVAIGVVGALGYIPNLKKLSDGFLVLILLGLFLSNKGFFTQFQNEVSALKSSSALSAGVGQITPAEQLAASSQQTVDPLSGELTLSPIDTSDITGLQDSFENTAIGGVATGTASLTNSSGSIVAIGPLGTIGQIQGPATGTAAITN